MDALECVQLLLPVGLCVVAIDFAGSGLSDGEHVTLGANEKRDLTALLAFLRSDASPFAVDRIALWGRSMGAVTSLLYSADDSSVTALVLDSPYSDLMALCRELVGHVVKFRVPGFAVSGALRVVRSSIKSRAGVDIGELAPIGVVERCQMPAMFCHGKDDDFVKPRHSKLLHAKYGGEKSLHLVAGDHK